MRKIALSVLAVLMLLGGTFAVETAAPRSLPAAIVEQAVPVHDALAANYTAWIPWRHWNSWEFAYQAQGGGQFYADGGDDTVDAVACIQYAISGNTNNPGWSACTNDTYAYHTNGISLTVTAEYGYSTYFRSYFSGCDDTYGHCVAGYSQWTWLVK